MIKLHLPPVKLPPPAQMAQVAQTCTTAPIWKPLGLDQDGPPPFPLRSIDELLELLDSGKGQQIRLLEWVMWLRGKQAWDQDHPDRAQSTACALWREALGNARLERLLNWRLALRAGGLDKARLTDSLWDTFNEYAEQRSDVPVVRLLKGMIGSEWSTIAAMAMQQRVRVQSLFTRLRLPSLLSVIDEINAALVPVFLQSPRTKTAAHWLLSCIQGLDTDAQVDAVEQLVRGVDAAEAADWSALHTWVLSRFGPHAENSLWSRLSAEAQQTLQTWLSAARYRDFERIVRLLTRHPPDDALSEEDQKDRKRLKNRSKFWANYRSRFEGLTILLPEATLDALGKQLSHLQSSDVVPLAHDGSEESELCIFEFTEGYIVEVFRGGCGESRFIPKDEFPHELLKKRTLGLKDLRRIGASETHDHVFLWQYSCERWLRDKGIRPDDGIRQFAGLPRAAGQYDSAKGLPRPDDRELADRHQQLQSWQRKMRRLEAEAGRPMNPQTPTSVVRVERDTLADEHQSPDMVFIKGGSFIMGSPTSEAGWRDNEGQHEVMVSDFWIGRYAVTFDEYDRFCIATGRTTPSDAGWGRGRRPVINVSWHDARAYCKWLSQQTGKIYRLPTEAEWEYACRAGTTTPFYFGATISTDQANYDGNRTYGSGRKGEYREQTTPVGQFPANAWGLYDMHGNVWEWTASVASESDHLMVRGGSWYEWPNELRSACRFSYTPNDRGDGQGFRVAKSLEIGGHDTQQTNTRAVDPTDPVIPTTDTKLIAGRYQVRGDNGEIIYDTTTGLEWQRCSLGQTWNGHTCTGEAKTYTWDDAHTAADRVPGWRLPTIDELKTLVYCSSGQPAQFGCQCSGDYQQPTIVTEAFPETPASRFWSGSPYANYSDSAWYVHFYHGYAGNALRSLNGRVRLVRGGQ